MHIITRKRLNEFIERHPTAKSPLEHWYRLMKAGAYPSFVIDTVGEDENHPLAALMEVIGVLIEKYEDEHVPELTPN